MKSPDGLLEKGYSTLAIRLEPAFLQAFCSVKWDRGIVSQHKAAQSLHPA